MIVLNNRYRGAMEYDKFAINIVNLDIIVNDMLKDNSLTGYNLKALKAKQEQVIDMYNKTAGILESINAYDISIS